MKFAKELDEELVPEWRAKYLDYKAGKKKVKAIDRAIQKSNWTAFSSSLQRVASDHENQSATPTHGTPPSADSSNNPGSPGKPGASSQAIPVRRQTPTPQNERQLLRNPDSRFSTVAGTYGSIIATPPQPHSTASDMGSIKLPDPAIDPRADTSPDQNRTRENDPKFPSPVFSRREAASNALEQKTDGSLQDRNPSFKSRSRGGKSSGSPAIRTPQFLKRVLSQPDREPREKSRMENSAREVDRRQDEFFSFLDSELHKIESFYQAKETEATQRLQALRQQLHTMRDRRIQQIRESERSRHQGGGGALQGHGFGLHGTMLRGAIRGRNQVEKHFGAQGHLASPEIEARDAHAIASRRDFSRRPESQNADVPYHSAKRKLKYAVREFYRGLELIKSYAYLNRTAFRKMNKKYDKVVHARPPMRYMSENVNGAWFVQSEVIENLMNEVEDLYTRYFERGNRKIAVSKLRRTGKKSGEFSQNSFRSGLLIMAGVLFGAQALVYAVQHLYNSDSSISSQTGYLLQLYGGFFLAVFHVLFFCLDCMIWTKSKINYVFVFEFDPRSALDWRQLSELPSLFLFLLGLFMWLNFRSIDVMYIYWPVVLIGLTTVILFLPYRLLYHRARKWWAFSNWRLLLSGLYPVEFRDFFMGDMYCSQAYAMGNLELFFCLYARHWTKLPQCNSRHSRLFGFFQCLPAVWRAFQCLRRFFDTKNVFPHLVNFGKYTFTILYYSTLSLYRIDKASRFQATFVTFALLNAIYCSVWDLVMDWSLCTKHKMLRRVLGFRRPWVYYIAMVVDVILRFNWIIYAIFTHNHRFSTLLSFVVSFSEIFRRGMWSIFRVENEHCTNVVLFRASRDVPLPYEFPSADGQADTDTQDTAEAVQLQNQLAGTPSDEEHGRQPTPGLRWRRQSRAGSISRVREVMAHAHAQDFQRTKQPHQILSYGPGRSSDDTSEEEDDEDAPYKDDVVDEELPFSNSQAWDADGGAGPPSADLN